MMSKERELVQKVLTKLNSYYYEGNVTIKNGIEELLVQPEQNKAEAVMPNGVSVSNVYDAYEEGRKSVMVEQEPVAWITEWVQRYRHNDTPIIDRAVSFTKGDAPAVPNPNYIPLYTALPTHLISAAPELLEALSNWINALDDPSEWMKCRDDAKKAIEKAHGITGVDDE